MRAVAAPLPPPRASQAAMRAPTVLGPGTRRSGEHGAVRASEGTVASSARASASFRAADAQGGLAPPPMSAFSVDAFVAGRTAERDAAGAEVARLQPIVAESSRASPPRAAASRARKSKIATTRKERAAEDERHRRQTNARLEGVGEARKTFRRVMGEVAKVALADARTFPADFGALERAEESTRRAASPRRARRRARSTTPRWTRSIARRCRRASSSARRPSCSS